MHYKLIIYFLKMLLHYFITFTRSFCHFLKVGYYHNIFYCAETFVWF